MLKRTALLGALAISSIGFMPMPAAADDDIRLDFSPPPPRYEILPAERPGFVWQPGYWEWRHGRHVWVRGHWVRERPGYHWQPSRWVERDGRWYFERGRWDRERYAHWDRERWERQRWRNPDGDRDGDGIPNADDRDRDGDGVPNRRDAYPNNPYRY